MLRNSLCAGATQLAPLWLFLIVSESFTGGASTMAVELEQSAAFLEPILGAHQQACVVSSRSSVPPAAALRTHCAGKKGSYRRRAGGLQNDICSVAVLTAETTSSRWSTKLLAM